MSTVLGEQLRRLRQAAGYTQRELAACVRVDHTYLSKIENGHGLPPSVNLLHRIAKVLQVDEEALCALVDRPSVAAMRRRTAALREQVAALKAALEAIAANRLADSGDCDGSCDYDGVGYDAHTGRCSLCIARTALAGKEGVQP